MAVQSPLETDGQIRPVATGYWYKRQALAPVDGCFLGTHRLMVAARGSGVALGKGKDGSESALTAFRSEPNGCCGYGDTKRSAYRSCEQTSNSQRETTRYHLMPPYTLCRLRL